ncbi:MAG: protein phosphatase 2C domain-containing protein [Ruminococcus sp.]|nr:protein phosphatase 2C domain-containing protein [Ruminococcus sp.]
MRTYFLKEHTIAGKRNITKGMQNQDNITVYEDNNIIMACVSDGCTDSKFPVEAGRMNGQTAVKASKVIWSMPEKKVKQYLNDSYNEIFSNSDFPYKQLCATTAFVMINKSTGAYIAFSVGDTAILSYNANGQFKMFLEPVNAFRKSATYFTNDSLSVRKFSQFKQGTLDDIAGFVIYSDGAENISQPPYTDIKRFVSSAYVSDESFNEEKENLFIKLKELDNDDISIALVAVSDDVISKNMTEYYNGFYTSSAEIPVSEQQPEQNADIPEKENEMPATSLAEITGDRKMTDFLAFLNIPRSPDEIYRSDIIARDDIVLTLTDLVRKHIVLCTADGRFIADRTF